MTSTTDALRPEHERAARRARHVRSGVAGVTAAGLAGVLLTLLTTPWVAVPAALLLVVLAPTASRLDRRLAVNLSLAFGLLPITTAVPTVIGPRTGLVAALSTAIGAAVAAAVLHPDRLRPRTRRRDGTVLVAGILAAAVAWPLRSPGTPERALAMLSTGIDNAYHFAVYLDLRLAAAGSPLVSANADGTGFAFDDYPSWFHRAMSVAAEAAFGGVGTAPVELVRFAQLEWVVFVALVVLVIAAVLQALPPHVPSSLLVVTVVALLGLLLGVPGGVNLLQGHLSFLLAACAPAVMLLLASTATRPGIGLFVVLGALVLVAGSWLFLLPTAGAALVVPLLQVWRRQNLVTRWASLAGAAGAFLVAFVVFVSGRVNRGGFDAVLRDGTIPRLSLPVIALVLAGCLGGLVLLARRRRDLGLSAYVLVTLAALLQTSAVGGYQMVEAGRLTYYFWKLALGSVLVVLVITLQAVVVAGGTRRTPPRGLRPLVAGALGLVGAAGLGVTLQNFTLPSAAWAVALPTSLADRPTAPETGDVGLVLRLAASMSPADAARTRLLATRPDDMNAAHASEWFHVLSYSATRRAMNVDDGVYDLAEDRGDVALAVRLAQSTLGTPDGEVLVTDPRLETAIRAAVTSDQAERVRLVR